MKGIKIKKVIKEVIKKYLKKMVEEFEDYGNCPSKPTTSLIDCPECGHLSIKFDEQAIEQKWKCGGCFFAFPKNLIPPSPKEIEDFLKRKKVREERKRTDKFMNKFFKKTKY